MKCLKGNSGGYTIIETMIVLTVSAMLFGSVVVVMSQQNRRTQFTQSVRTFAQELSDVLNDVETGFYPSNNNISCTAGNDPVPDPKQQGTNDQCIFVGKAIVPSGGSFPAGSIKIDTIVGDRQTDGEEVTNIADANPRIVSFLNDQKSLSSGVSVIKLLAVNDTGLDVAGLAVLASFGSSGEDGLFSGIGTRTTLATIDGDGVSGINQENITNASGGVIICLTEGDGGRQALIQIGGASLQDLQDPVVTIDPSDMEFDKCLL